MTTPKSRQIAIRVSDDDYEFIKSSGASVASLVRIALGLLRQDRLTAGRVVMGEKGARIVFPDDAAYTNAPDMNAVWDARKARLDAFQVQVEAQPEPRPKPATMTLQWPASRNPNQTTYIKGLATTPERLVIPAEEGETFDQETSWCIWSVPRQGDRWTNHSIWPTLGVAKMAASDTNMVHYMFEVGSLLQLLGLTRDEVELQNADGAGTKTYGGFEFCWGDWLAYALAAYEARQNKLSDPDFPRLKKWLEHPGRDI